MKGQQDAMLQPEYDMLVMFSVRVCGTLTVCVPGGHGHQASDVCLAHGLDNG